MKPMISAIAIAACIAFSVTALAEDEAISEETQNQILEALKGLGCTEIQGETEDEGLHFEVDDIICQGHSYDIQIDKDMKIITMVRDPSAIAR